MSNREVQIRPIFEEDSYEELTEFLHAAYSSLMASGLNYTAGYQDVETTKSRCRSGTCFVATFEDQIIGTILIKPNSDAGNCESYCESGGASIHQFAVHPDFRGRGIAKLLHASALDVARDWGCRFVALDTATSAQNLVSMYQSWGYGIVEEVQWPGKTYTSYVMALQI